MKFSKGKVIGLALAGAIALGGVGGAAAAIVKATQQTNEFGSDSAIRISFDKTESRTTLGDVNLTIDRPIVQQKVTITSNQSKDLTKTGKATFTFTSVPESANLSALEILVTTKSDFKPATAEEKENQTANSFVLNSVTTNNFFNFTIGTTVTYYVQYSLKTTTNASEVQTTTYASGNVNVGSLTVALSTNE